MPEASLVAQMVENLPAVRETHIRSLGQDDPLEKYTATHSSILARRIQWTEEPSELQSMESQESDTTEQLGTDIVGSPVSVLCLVTPVVSDSLQPRGL